MVSLRLIFSAYSKKNIFTFLSYNDKPNKITDILGGSLDFL